MTSSTFPYLPDSCLVVLIGASGAGKSTLTRTWPASQVVTCLARALNGDLDDSEDIACSVQGGLNDADQEHDHHADEALRETAGSAR
ncbi:hypothetical protein ACFWBC_36975 [Streptomyces sp. NPDC059985]|uniref:hypothetical protein n=1 Tax=Streptomyces sp. NPDC059985 TaxID=3347025 RepID=UPI0036C67983